MKSKTFTLVMLLLHLCFWSGAQIIHVPVDQSTIQQAINAATDGDTVLVAEGTYFENINFRGKAITVGSKYILNGNTSHISKTVIDGSKPTHADSASVVTLNSGEDTTSVLNGFTITGGKGNRIYFTSLKFYVKGGGGVSIEFCGGKIVNNNIRGNHVVARGIEAGGGGLNAFSHEVIKKNTVIRNNKVFSNSVTSNTYAQGAGIAFVGGRGMTLLENNVVYENISTCTGNWKANAGGIMMASFEPWNTSIIVRNNKIVYNEIHCIAAQGGGIFFTFPPFSSHYVVNKPTIEIYNNIIAHNTSTDYAGGVAFWDQNSNRDYRVHPSICFYNNTVVNNRAKNGVGLFNYRMKLLLYNNIFNNDPSQAGAKEIYTHDIPYPNMPTNDGIIHAFNNNFSDNFAGTDNVLGYPAVDPETFELEKFSPCIGKGITSFQVNLEWYDAPIQDLYGENRFGNPSQQMDLGAIVSKHPYYNSSTILNVPTEHPGIQMAIEAAKVGDTILVDEGVYYENINFRGKAITVASHFILNGYTSHISKTIIDGGKPTHPDSASVVTFNSGEDSTSILNGFTITGGAGSRIIVPQLVYKGGGGICLLESGGKIIHNNITANHIKSTDIQVHGGGILSAVMEKNNDKSLFIRDNKVHENQITSNSYCVGAGITFSNNDGMSLCEGNKIYKNRAIATGNKVAGGGGVCLFSEVPWKPVMTLRNNQIYKNEISGIFAVGAGVYFFILPLIEPFQDEKSFIEIYNNLITENKSLHDGGGIALWSDASEPATANFPIPVIFNNTVVNNTAVHGTGIMNHRMKTLVFNNIFWNEGLGTESEEFYKGTFIQSHNTVRGEEAQLNHLNIKPTFQLNSYQLAGNCLCINTGADSVRVNDTWYYAAPHDLFGNQRPYRTSASKGVDIGAIESPYEDPTKMHIKVPEKVATIQEAIDMAYTDDTVLVAEGVYYENINFKGKAITVASNFIMDGDTSHISKTIINGSKPNHPDSASVVLFISGEDSTSVLHGFTITGGAGSILTHEHFKDVFKVGGGIAILNGGGKIIHNKIRGNTVYADGLHAWGAGISSSTSIARTVVIRDNQIENNQTNSTTFSLGAGISAYNDKGTFLCEGNTIVKNKVTTRGSDVAGGGGVCMLSLSPWNTTMTLRNNVISLNEVYRGNALGGGIYFVIPVPELNGSFLDKKSHIEIYNNIITKNKSSRYGGGIAIAYGKTTFVNADNPVPVIYNNTVCDNTAINGTGVYIVDMKPLFFNNIFWNVDPLKTNNEFYKVNKGTDIKINNTMSGEVAEPDNFNIEPGFMEDSYALSPKSQCVDKGIWSALVGLYRYYAPAFDFNDNARPYKGHATRRGYDLGAIESRFDTYPTILRVPGEVSTIQEAIDLCQHGDTVLVDEGTYYENINFKGKAITVASYFIRDGDTSHISKTVIDGSKATNSLNASVVRFDNCKDTTSVLEGFSVTGGKGERVFVSPYYVRGSGAIRIVDASGKVVNNKLYGNSLSSNWPNEYCFGGAVGIGNLQMLPNKVVIRKNNIFDNHLHSLSYVRGGAIYADCRSGSIVIEENNIYQNTITSSTSFVATGGGIYINKNNHVTAKLCIRNNTIHDNAVHGENGMGGGIHIFLSRFKALENPSNYHPSEIYNNIIFNNTSDYFGGGISLWNEGPEKDLPDVLPDPIISNNTIVNNRSKVAAGLFNYHSEAVLFNNIFWNDLSTKNCTEFFNEKLDGQSNNAGILHVFNNAIQRGYPGDGNVNLDPQMDPLTFQIAETIPCVGKGMDSIVVDEHVFYAPLYDYFGKNRLLFADGKIDVGAIESALNTRLRDSKSEEKQWQLYPNPTTGLFSVHFAVDKKQVVKLSMYNVLGQQEKGLINEVRSPGTFDVQVDISALRNGVYFMVLETNTKTTTKLIKQ